MVFIPTIYEFIHASSFVGTGGYVLSYIFRLTWLSMCQFMPFQTYFLVKSFPTCFTTIGLVPRVNHPVSSQIINLGESLATYLTNKWLLPSVSSKMNFQCCLEFESQATICANPIQSTLPTLCCWLGRLVCRTASQTHILSMWLHSVHPYEEWVPLLVNRQLWTTAGISPVHLYFSCLTAWAEFWKSAKIPLC